MVNALSVGKTGDSYKDSVYIYTCIYIIVTVTWSEVPDHVKLTGTDHQIKRDAERRVWSSDPRLSTWLDPAMHIFRFIPFSIPFRFPFRVLVTPYQEEPIWCREWLSKWHLIHLWYRGLTFEVFTWMNESHGMTPQLIQRPCFFPMYLHSWVNLMEWHLKWCRGLTFEVLTCMF